MHRLGIPYKPVPFPASCVEKNKNAAIVLKPYSTKYFYLICNQHNGLHSLPLFNSCKILRRIETEQNVHFLNSIVIEAKIRYNVKSSTGIARCVWWTRHLRNPDDVSASSGCCKFCFLKFIILLLEKECNLFSVLFALQTFFLSSKYHFQLNLQFILWF